MGETNRSKTGFMLRHPQIANHPATDPAAQNYRPVHRRLRLRAGR